MQFLSFRRHGLALLCLLFLAFSSSLSAGVIVTLYLAPGPAPGSPDLTTFYANAITGLENGGVATGTGTAIWSPIAVIQPQYLIDTSNSTDGVTAGPGAVNSWMGVPGTSEYGTDLYFSESVIATGGYSVKLDGMTFSANFGSQGTLSYTYGAAFGDKYGSASSGLVGFNGVTDLSTTNGGNPAQAATAIYFAGAAAYYGNVVCPPCGQTDLNSYVNQLSAANIGSVPSQYTVFDKLPTGGSSSVQGTTDTPFAAAVPEPGTISLALAGLAALVYRKYRSR